jgi:ATP-dependent DNA helicase RecG
MKRFTDQELEVLLTSIESDSVERKESFKEDVPKKARETNCAFSNDMPNHNEAGVIYRAKR